MKMKLLFPLLAVVLACSEAFSPSRLIGGRASTTIMTSRHMSTRADSSALVEEALKISKEFGATSPEARLAWEAVEEVDASDNSAATKGSLDEECEVEPVNPDCIEYSKNLDELATLLEANEPNLTSLASSMADSVNQ